MTHPSRVTIKVDQVREAVALFDFVGDKDDNQLSFKFGDLVVMPMEDLDDPEWAVGHLKDQPAEWLYFPKSFVKLLTSEKP